MRVVVGPVGDFPRGAPDRAGGRRSIGVFRVGERFYGIRNRCPHQGGPLCRGHVLGDAVADQPGRPRVSSEPTCDRLPWHGWEYDLASGQSFMGASQAGVRSYGVAVRPAGRCSPSWKPARRTCARPVRGGDLRGASGRLRGPRGLNGRQTDDPDRYATRDTGTDERSRPADRLRRARPGDGADAGRAHEPGPAGCSIASAAARRG